MNIESIESFFRDKKEAIKIELENLQSRKDLKILLEEGGFISEAKYYRDGESVFLGKNLELRGYHPEDTLPQNIKGNINGPAEIKISVIGDGFFERIRIIKRK